MVTKNLLISIIILVSPICFAQKPTSDLVCSAGSITEDETYEIDWSVGEIAIETLTGKSMLLAQGFHQGTLEITTLISNTSDNINLEVYPNPTSKYINLTTELKPDKLKININSLNGITIFSGEISNLPWRFNLSNYAPGVYMLLVSDDDQLLKSFKIIKH